MAKALIFPFGPNVKFLMTLTPTMSISEAFPQPRVRRSVYVLGRGAHGQSCHLRDHADRPPSQSRPGRRLGSESLGWPERAGPHQWVVARGLPGVGCPAALEVRLAQRAPGPGKRGTCCGGTWSETTRGRPASGGAGFVLRSSSLAEID